MNVGIFGIPVGNCLSNFHDKIYFYFYVTLLSRYNRLMERVEQ